jgi:hypothetical protein
VPNTPKPPKKDMSPSELNDWRAGQDEMEMDKEKTKDIKPVVKAPAPKRYARGGGVEIKGKTKGRFV